MNTVEWKTIPWILIPKMPKDKLLDILAGVPELLENIEGMGTSSDPAERQQLLEATMRYGGELVAELEKWHEIHQHHICTPATEDPVPIQFPSFDIAHITVFYWTTACLLHGCLKWALRFKSLDPSISASCITAPTIINIKSPKLYAYRIMQSVAHFFEPQWGVFGATTIAFPTGVAFKCVKDHGTEEDKPYLELVFRTWSDDKLPGAIKRFLKSMGQESAGR